jgi:hypothetical protein
MFKRMSAVFLSLVLLLAIPRRAVPQDEGRSITTPCNAHLAALSETGPHAYEKHFEWAKTPSAAKEFAEKALPNTVDLIAVAPVTAEDYQTIFRTSQKPVQVTEAQRKEIESVQNALKADFGRDEGDRAFNKADYKKVVQAKTASYVIVIGHNENGMLRLLDGNLLYLDEIVASARPEQRIILISCDSAGHVSNAQIAGTVGREVTYGEAFTIASGIMKFIRGAGRSVALSDVQAELAEQGVSNAQKVAFFVMKAVCAGGALIVVALIIRQLDPCNDKDSSCHDQGGPSDADSKSKKNSAKSAPATNASDSALLVLQVLPDCLLRLHSAH